VKITTRILILCTFILVTQAACPTPKPIGPIINAVVDCLGSNRPQIDRLLTEFKGPILGGGSINWVDVKQRAKHAGKDIGGCVIMELTQWFLSGTRSTPESAKAAYDAAEEFRNTTGEGAVYSTMCVREDGTKNACKL
jgi:hypothetical protein